MGGPVLEQLGGHVAGGAMLGLQASTTHLWKDAAPGSVKELGSNRRLMGHQHQQPSKDTALELPRAQHPRPPNACPVAPTDGSCCRGVLLMSERRRESPNPPSLMRPFSSSRMLLGFRSQ